jgi:hypothetical protein
MEQPFAQMIHHKGTKDTRRESAKRQRAVDGHILSILAVFSSVLFVSLW